MAAQPAPLMNLRQRGFLGVIGIRGNSLAGSSGLVWAASSDTSVSSIETFDDEDLDGATDGCGLSGKDVIPAVIADG
ncbi:MAG: hypothetical protein AAFW84_33525 [Cyanobacteria bacterium J06635_15]